MNVDLEVLTKELEYINLCIKSCTKVDVLCELLAIFDSLNMLYKHLTDEYYKEPEFHLIKYKEYENYLKKRDKKINMSFLNRYESEKKFVANIMINFLVKFNDCYGDICYKKTEPLIFSHDEAKYLILDYFSQFDKRIYDIAVSIFENKLIQTGISDSFEESKGLEKLKYYLSAFGNLNTADFTEESNKRLLRFYELILKKVVLDDNIPEERYNAYSERLMRHYDGLIPKDENYEKKSFEYDDCGDYLAIAVAALPLKKTYIGILNENIDIQTLISIVHEIGHAIEDQISVFENNKLAHCDSEYLCEVSSSFFEFGFYKYLLEKNIDYEACEKILFDWYLDVCDDFETLYDTVDLTPDKNIEAGQVTYRKNDYECNIDLNNRFKYGFSRYLAIILYKKYHENSDEFYDLFKSFLDNREILGTEELLNNFGITNEELLDISFLDEDINKLVKRFNN